MSLLSKATQTILDPESFPGDLLGAVRDLQREFAQLTGVHDTSEDPADRQATMLDGGTAISPQDAARCILDFARTTVFLRGIREAISEARTRFGDTTIEVLYAFPMPDLAAVHSMESYVKDVVRVALWFSSQPDKSGIFNCGTGRSRTFNEVASQVIRTRGRGEIEYIPFPESLRGHYQSFTEADLTQLRGIGYSQEFVPLEEGIREYLLWRTDAGEV